MACIAPHTDEWAFVECPICGDYEIGYLQDDGTYRCDNSLCGPLYSQEAQND